MTPQEYIRQLEETILQLTAETDTAIQRIQEIEKKVEKLEKKLRFYEDPHTPPFELNNY